VKYCLSARQPENVLKKADEIKINAQNFRTISDYIDAYPDKALILEFENDLPENFNWDLIEMYSKKHSEFYCAAANDIQMTECRVRGIKFYYKYTVSSFYELQALKEAGVSYVMIGVPLIFDLDNVARYGIPMRAIPNIAYEPYLLHNDGICGGWVRPEDVEAYGKYIDTFEFYAPNMPEKEATLYHIYAENGKWPGNLELLIDFLNVEVNNVAIEDQEGFAEKRMHCKQRCVQSGTCHYCEDQVRFISTVLKYRKQKSQN
jgi:hypothetical protein